jgi:lipid A 3-O-deacylase
VRLYRSGPTARQDSGCYHTTASSHIRYKVAFEKANASHPDWVAYSLANGGSCCSKWCADLLKFSKVICTIAAACASLLPGLRMAAAADLPRVPEWETSPPPIASPPPSFWEVRVGATAHDPWSPERGSADFNGELLVGRIFTKPDAWIPRFHLGASINTGGKTSYGYAGFTWTFDLVDSVFIEGSFGGAVHNGSTGDQLSPGQRAWLLAVVS